jgi:hypothetical protein
MDYENYKYKSDYFRKDIDKARDEGRLLAARGFVLKVARSRIGELGSHLVERVEACDDFERLEKLTLDMIGATDPVAVEKLLHDF